MTAPYYQDELVTLYCADNADILPALSNIDMVFTSPPYNLGTSSGGGMHRGSLAVRGLAGGYSGEYGDNLPQDQYDQWQRRVVRLMWDTLSPSGAIFYNHKPRPQAGRLILPTDYGNGLPLRQIIIWDKGAGMNFSQRFFLPKHEWVVVWARPGWQLRDKSASQVGDVWAVRPEQDTNHPAPFPVGLPAMAINAAQPSLVLDPFAGSGTTLLAAKEAGVRSIGIEQSEKYCEIAVQRLAQDSLFAPNGRT